MTRPTNIDHASVPLQRPLASGLTVVGTLLIVLGLGRALVALAVLPAEVATFLSDWWPAAIVLAGIALAASGRRASGTVLALIGGLLLLTTAVPEGFVAPVVLIGLGVLFLATTMGGRRWTLGGPTVAVVDDVDTRTTGGRSGQDDPTRSFVAVFGEAAGRLDPAQVGRGPVECLAVFGDVKVDVPDDVAVELTQTAVFGDVRAPEPPAGEVVATVAVRATSVFGDVRLRRH